MAKDAEKGSDGHRPSLFAWAGTVGTAVVLAAAGVLGTGIGQATWNSIVRFFTNSDEPKAIEPTCDDPNGLTVATVGIPTAASVLGAEKTRSRGTLTYVPANAVDDDTGTSWVEGVPGYGP